MSRDQESGIAAVAARQHGVITRGQLLELGVCRTVIVHRLRSRRLTALHRGVYLCLPFPLTHTRAMAAVLACGPGALLSHRSGGSMWGMPSAAPENAPVDVTIVGNRGRRPGIRLHRVGRLDEDEGSEKEGIAITTPARTLLDLARVLGAAELERAVAVAEREGLVDREQLARLLERHAGEQGTPKLRAVLDLPGGPALTRSSAEQEFLSLIREAGLPRPECNVSFGRYEIDFFWRAARIAVEVDGFRYHSTRPRFEGDRRKDAHLLSAGVSVVRLSWRQITQQRLATAVQLGQALTLAGNRR